MPAETFQEREDCSGKDPVCRHPLQCLSSSSFRPLPKTRGTEGVPTAAIMAVNEEGLPTVCIDCRTGHMSVLQHLTSPGIPR